MRIKKFEEINETNGPASGKEESTKKGLKGIPLTTDNPMILKPDLDEDDLVDDTTGVADDTSLSDAEIEYDMNTPKPTIDIKKDSRKKLKKFNELKE